MIALLWIGGLYLVFLAVLKTLAYMERKKSQRIVRRWRAEADEAMNGDWRREQERRRREAK